MLGNWRWRWRRVSSGSSKAWETWGGEEVHVGMGVQTEKMVEEEGCEGRREFTSAESKADSRWDGMRMAYQRGK
jgi:hypothetical protein